MRPRPTFSRDGVSVDACAPWYRHPALAPRRLARDVVCFAVGLLLAAGTLAAARALGLLAG